MVAGFCSAVILKSLAVSGVVSLPAYFDPILVGIVTSFVTILLVSKSGTIKPEELQFRNEIHIAPPELANPTEARKTMLWPRLMMLWGALTTASLIVFYVRPYQLATGLVSETGAYIVYSGESLLALSFGAILFAGGLFSHWAIRRFYTTEVLSDRRETDLNLH